jgi:hypothetical protein
MTGISAPPQVSRSAYRNETRGGYAAMPCLETTVTVQRMGLLDLTSITERTIPVTGIPFNITVACWPRYWAKRQRWASIGSVISIGGMHHQWSRYAKQFRDDLHDIEQPLIMIPNRCFASGQSSQRTLIIQHVANIAQSRRVRFAAAISTSKRPRNWTRGPVFIRVRKGSPGASLNATGEAF